MIKIGIVLLTAVFSLNIGNYNPNISNDIKTSVSIENLDNQEMKEEIKDCSAGIMSSGSCVLSLGDVCSFHSEWTLNSVWQSDENDYEE